MPSICFDSNYFDNIILPFLGNTYKSKCMYLKSNYEISMIELKKNGKPKHKHMSFPIITIY
jgi:hypothetical protein